jgi:thymidylate kinase
MIVICIEGCHGSGKSAICKHLAALGFPVLDEGFLDMPSFSLHPQTLTMESIWVSMWFQRLLTKQQEEDKTRTSNHTIYFADRSPYSAVLYSKRCGNLLRPLIDQQIAELAQQADIHIYTVYVKVEKEILWRRIQQRLKLEPARRKYNEDSRAWMEAVCEFYDDEERKWDFVVDNNESPLSEVGCVLLRKLCSAVKDFEDNCPRYFLLPSSSASMPGVKVC